MVERNLFCDQGGCGEPAIVFGFAQSAKTRACRDHALSLVDKRVTLFDIAAYDFVQSAKDAPQYEQRRRLMQKGLGTVTAMETKCESDLVEAQTGLLASTVAVFEVAVKSYQEQWERTCTRYKETMKSLRASRSHFERLIADKDFQLNPEDLGLCESVPSGSLFRLVTGDCRLAVVSVLMSHFVLLPIDEKAKLDASRRKAEVTRLMEEARKQAEEGSTDIAEAVVSFATELDAAASGTDFKFATAQFKAAIPKQLAALLPNAFKRDPKQAAEECQVAADEANKRGEFNKAVAELQDGRALLQQQALGSSDLFLHLSNCLAETYHQCARWQEMLTLCEHTLEVWTRDSSSTEGLQALFYLITAHYWLQHTKLRTIIADWPNKFVFRSPLDHCLMLHTQAIELMSIERLEEAVEISIQALQLCEQFAPESYLLACSRVTLARVYQDMCNLEKPEKQLLKAQQVLTVHFPNCYFTGLCLSFLGELYRTLGKMDLAEEKWQRARHIYTQHFPQSNQLVACLKNLASYNQDRHRLDEADQQFTEALRILYVAFPQSLELGQCLALLAGLYNKMMHTKKAETHYQKACQHFSVHFPDSSDYAECLMELAILLETKGNKKKAASKVATARQIYLNAGCLGLAEACSFFLLRLL